MCICVCVYTCVIILLLLDMCFHSFYQPSVLYQGPLYVNMAGLQPGRRSTPGLCHPVQSGQLAPVGGEDWTAWRL